MFIIAEIAQAHEGSLGIAHSYIDALADTGVDAVKFQTHIADAESSIHEPFRVNFSYEDKSRYDYWKRMEFGKDEWVSLKQHCEDKGLEFISSPFSNAAVELLEQIGVKRYKIGSGEVNNFLMLRRIAETGKPILLSSGMSSYEELDKTIEFLKPYKNHLSILQCTTAYPTNPKEWGLNVIYELKERYGLPVGFSDHSGGITASIAAAANGAEIFEFHAVFSRKMFGPDAQASLEIDEIKYLTTSLHDVRTAKENSVNKNNNSRFRTLKKIFEKSLAINCDIKKGDVIGIEMLEAKKPKGFGVDASEFNSVIGKKAKKDLSKWSFIKKDDLI